MNWKKMLESKRIKVLLIGVVTLVANDLMGWGLSPETIDRFVLMILGFIGMQSVSDLGLYFGKGKAEVEAKNGNGTKKPGT